MDNFVYEYPTKVLFGKGAAREHLGKALSAYGPNVMLAYGGSSIHKNSVYDEMMEILDGAGKTVTEFHGIMPNPTYAKVREARRWPGRRTLTSSWRWAAARSLTAAR